MQLIGFLGGMSWESTAEYYRLANELVRDRLRWAALRPLPHVLGRLRRHRADAGRGQVGRRRAGAGPRRTGTGRWRSGLPGALHQHDAQGRGPADRPGRHPVAAHRRHHSGGHHRGRRRSGRPARHGVHDVPALLPRPAGRARHRCPCAVARRPGGGAPHHLRRALPGRHPRRVARAVPAGHRPPRRRRRRGDHLRLHRDRAARRPAGQPRAGLPHDSAARRGCRGPGARRVQPCGGPSFPSVADR